MNGHERKVNMKKSKTRQSQSSKWKFHKVLDTRGKSVPNLWQRNGRYYAQLTVTEGGRSKISIEVADDCALRVVVERRMKLQYDSVGCRRNIGQAFISLICLVAMPIGRSRGTPAQIGNQTK